MPTTAQMQYDQMQNEMYRSVLGQQAALQAAKVAADAQKYGYDTQLKGADLTSGRALQGTESTNAARLQGIGLEQGGMTDRAGMEQQGANYRAGVAVQPQMGELELKRQALMSSMDYIKASMAREALGLPPLSPPAGGGMPSGGGSWTGQGPAMQPAGGTAPAMAGTRAAPTSSAPRDPYDMTGFNADVSGIAANIDAARGTSNAMGPDDLPQANAWTPGASVRDVSGIPRTVAFPDASSSSTPNRAAIAAKVKQQILDEATAGPGRAAASPTAAAPTASAPAQRPPLTADARALLGLPPDAATKRTNDLMSALVPAAANGDPRAIRTLEAMDPATWKGKFTPNPAMQRQLQADVASAGTTGAIADLLPDITALEQKVAAPNFWVNAKDRQQITEDINNILLKAQASGRADQIPAIKAEIARRLQPSIERAGLHGFGPSPAQMLGDKVRGDIGDVVSQALR